MAGDSSRLRTLTCDKTHVEASEHRGLNHFQKQLNAFLLKCFNLFNDIPFCGKMTMLSARMPVSRENCLNFCCRVTVTSGVRPANRMGCFNLKSINSTNNALPQGASTDCCGVTDRRLTVKIIEDLRHSFLCLCRVDKSVVIVHNINNAHVVVIVPN